MNRNMFSSFLARLIGKISWTSPPWFSRAKGSFNPKQFFIGLAALILVSTVAIYTYHWYKNLPKPLLVTAKINTPGITPKDEERLIPENLSISFGIPSANLQLTPQSVAPLNMVGKEVTKGITITPEIPGKWTWDSDNQLVFRPAQDWPAGQAYTINFDKSVFSPQTKLETLSYSFSTHSFKAKIEELSFYQDPLDPKLRQVIATIDFNYPVDTNSFENKTSLILEAVKKYHAEQYKFTVTYDEHKRTAYIHSEPITLPKEPRYLNLILDKNIKTINGPGTTENEITKSVLIPDANSYFKITDASSSIVRNEKDRPEQVLTIETSLGVTEKELNKSLHVYLLPKDYPATANEKEKPDYTWRNPGEITDSILALATPLTLQGLPADRDFATLHSYKLKATTPRYMYVTIDKGIQGFGDFQLTHAFSTIIPVPAFPEEINFLHKGSLLALSGEKKLSVIVRGIPVVKFKIARVLPDYINHLITQTSGDFSNPSFISPDQFNENNISQISSEIQHFEKEGEDNYTALDLEKYLKQNNAKGPLGLFLLEATEWNEDTKEEGDVKNSRLILITDLGLVVKDNNDGTHDVFVQSITKGDPQAGVKVSLLGKNGLAILSAITDAQGHVSFPSVKDFTLDKEPTVYVASLGQDVSFIPFNNNERQLNYTKFYIGGVYTADQEVKSLSAYVFSDRGIYRPGDTAHIGMIIKHAYVKPQPAGLPLQVIVTDSRGTEIQNQKMTLDETGFLSTDIKTEPTSPTGQYNINVFIVKDNHPSNLLGSTTINVAEFQPDRMRITSHLSAENIKGWVSPVGLKADIGLWNLYGAPAADRKIKAKILLAPQTIHFEEFPNYNFVDPLFDPNKPPKVLTETLTDTQTNEKGEAVFDLNLGRFDKATYQLTVFSEGFEAEGGRSVTTQTSALVSPLEYLIGNKADGDLNYISQNSPRIIHFIAIDPQLKQIAKNDLRIQILSLHPVTTLVKNPNGTYQYKSIIQTTVINTIPFTISENGSDFRLPSDQIGDFAVNVIDQNNTELSRLKYSVVGSSQLAMAKNAELTVKLNKKSYATGEDIELQINAPYTGAGLITIERDKVYAYQWFKTDMTNSLQKIHIPENFEGNGYVNITFVRDWNSPEIYTSPLSYSAIPFSVNHENHAIHIDLTSENLGKPGEPLNITYKTDKPGKIVVFAVDEGILQVANYQTPNPLDFFFQKNALEVITQQTVDQILPKFIAERELSAVGGDGSVQAALFKNLNPFKRKTDLPVAYWSGILDSDSTEHSVTYQVPDYFNGKLRIMAVAVASDSVGSANKSAEIRGDFIINPNVPTFVSPNDEFEITASVANNVKDSGKEANVTVELQTSAHLEVSGDTKQVVKINEGQEQTLRFKLKAKALLGSAQITLRATLKDKSSTMNSTLSVRPASAYFTTINSGTTSDKNKTLNLDRVLYAEYRNVEAAVSTSPLILVVGLQRYLDNYPYGCTEQLVSKAFPLLAMSNQPWYATDLPTLNEKVQATIQMLGQRQKSNGSISYWPDMGDNSNNKFASVYAIHFLTEAKAHGFNVPSQIMQNGINYLKELSSEEIHNLDEARIQAYAIYILTRNEIVTTNYLTHLQLTLDNDKEKPWHEDIISAYMASTYQLLKSYNEANQLINYYKPEKTNAFSGFYNNDVENAQYLYLLSHHFPDLLKKKGSSLIIPIVNAMNNEEINTLFSSYASIALSAYSQSYQTGGEAALNIEALLDHDKTKTLLESKNLFEKINIEDFAKGIVIHNPSKQFYFYQLTQSGFDKDLAKKDLKEGIEISREFQYANASVNEVELGNELEVHIHIRSLNDSYLNNIAIVDLLPGGFEVVRDSIKTEGLEYSDIREDRVIFFGSFGPEIKEIVYRIKATNRGSYLVAPIYASSMYNPKIRAHSTSSEIKIK